LRRALGEEQDLATATSQPYARGMTPSSPYRDGLCPLRVRLADHASRLAELDAALARYRRPLSNLQRRRLARLRRRATPAGDTAKGLMDAERALARYGRCIDDSLGLAADLRRTLSPVFPSPVTLLRWAGFVAVALVLLLGAVKQLGLGDFMLQAFGVTVPRLNADIPCERVAYEATTAALAE
jgi:hypothetical protein